MLRIINQQADVTAELERICDRTHNEQWLAQEATVRDILQAVKHLGDKAVVHHTQAYGEILTELELHVTGSELDAAYQQVSPEFLQGIRLASSQIESFHRQHIPKSWVTFGDDEVVLGKRYTPVERVGLYLPHGRGGHPSTVLMSAIPAQVAGVERIVMVTPPRINPAVLVAAQEVGIKEIYRLGGAAAIGALAYGTDTIPQVDIIVGSGGIDIQLAKKMVYGTVGINGLGGASEVVIIADDGANPANVATDLLAQAEHDPMAAAILLTTDAALAKNVQLAVERQLVNHPHRIDTEKAIAHYGLILLVDSLETAAELVNKFAPENLELQIQEPWALLPKIRHAGSIFLGYSTPEAVGDYIAGTNHILPTARTARYASPLGVETFLKHSSIVQYSTPALQKVAAAIEALAKAEGLPSHSESVRRRIQHQE